MRCKHCARKVHLSRDGWIWLDERESTFCYASPAPLHEHAVS